MHSKASGAFDGYEWSLKTITHRSKEYAEHLQRSDPNYNPRLHYEIRYKGKIKITGGFGSSWTFERAIIEIKRKIKERADRRRRITWR